MTVRRCLLWAEHSSPSEPIRGTSVVPLGGSYWVDVRPLHPDHTPGRPPLIVLQCDACNKVLSDSSALVFSDERRDVIVVKAASHIAVDEKVHAEHQGDTTSFAPASCRERQFSEGTGPIARRYDSPDTAVPFIASQSE